ncbi:uncharacterized protein DS421_15g511600 [Arachis hypogaea]|nr:uncharacterized protein DS421_15g511600 [Arachis hypogaea]
MHEQKHAMTLGLSKSNVTQYNPSAASPTRFAPNRSLNPVSPNLRTATQNSTHAASASIVSQASSPSSRMTPLYSRNLPSLIFAREEKKGCAIIVTKKLARPPL